MIRSWAAALALVLFAGSAGAQVRLGTFGWNEKNRPAVAPFAGYEYVYLAPRGALSPGAADSLRSFGATPLVLLQPTLAVSGGAPLTGPDYPWDTALAGLTARHGALLRGPDGAPIDLFPGDRWDAWVLDYRDSAFVDSLAALIVGTFMPKSGGIVWDYGCGDLSWAALPGADPAIWPAWRRGFARLVARVRAARGGGLQIAQCDQWPGELAPGFDGILLEQAGWSLNPAAKGWATATRFPNRWILIRQEDQVASRRRLFAAIAYLTGARFNQCNLQGDFGGGTDQNFHDLEHWGLDIGVSGGPWFERAPGIYQRMFSRGLVIANVSGSMLVYPYNKATTFIIPRGDGLVLQNRDARGRFIHAVTDYGR